MSESKPKVSGLSLSLHHMASGSPLFLFSAASLLLSLGALAVRAGHEEKKGAMAHFKMILGSIGIVVGSVAMIGVGFVNNEKIRSHAAIQKIISRARESHKA